MNYLTKECTKFLQGLKKNNRKIWFDEHRDTYEQHVKKPFRSLIDALSERIAEVDPFYACTAAQAVFRINRDVRFSKNKEPYKTNIAAVLGPGGRKGMPGFYVHIEPSKTFVGGGAYEVDKDKLNSIRSFLLKHPGALEQAVQDKHFAKTYGEILGEKNKTLPPLFKEAAAEHPYLYHKQFYFMHEFKTSELITAEDQVGLLFTYFLASLSVNNVLRDALEA